MLSTGLCHTEVLGTASAWGRDLIASTLIMQLWLNPLFPSDSQGGVQNVGLARSQKTFCFLAFSPSCSDFGQAASSQCASLRPEQPVYSSGIIFILVLMTSSFFKVFLICQTKAGEHEALVKYTGKHKPKCIHVQWPLKLGYQAPHLEV